MGGGTNNRQPTNLTLYFNVIFRIAPLRIDVPMITKQGESLKLAVSVYRS